MTKVLKLLGGGFLAAILLCVAFSAIGNDNGTSNAAPSIDRVSAHVLPAAGVAQVVTAVDDTISHPSLYLPGDINATSPVARAAGTSNPLIALPASLIRDVDSLKADSLAQSYSPQSPLANVAASGTVKGINNDTKFLNALVRYMKINTINVSRSPANNLGNNVDFLNDSAGGQPNIYSLTSRWSLITWAGANASASYVKGTDISGMNPDATNNVIVTAIYGYNDVAKQYTQILPSGVNVLDATTKMTLSTGQAYWIAMTTDPTAKGIRYGNLAWADTVDHYALAIAAHEGDNVQYIDPFIPTVAVGGGPVLDNGTLKTNALDPAECAGSCQLHAMDATTATRTGVGMKSIIAEWNVLENAIYEPMAVTVNGDYHHLGTTVGSGTITAPSDYPKATTFWINTIASWKNYQLNAVNLTNSADISGATQSQAWIKVSNISGADHGTTLHSMQGTTLTDPAFLGIVALVSILAAIAIAAWTTSGQDMSNQLRASRALGAG